MIGKPKNQVFLFFGFFVFQFFAIGRINFAYAKEITILFTGETHAMLYPCSCPREPDGGIARRGALIRQLREKNPDTLLLDSGAVFAAGLQDEYTQSAQLDMQRTLVNLKAIGLLKYDAIAVGDDEFNFGREFLEENAAKTGLPFLSCNISPAGEKARAFLPYIIKEAAGVKIGIIGVTNVLAAQKVSGLKFTEPKIAVKQAVEDLKKSNAAIIIVLSHLGETDDLNLIKDVPGIDILIVGHSRQKEEVSAKIGSTLILRPSWQGRRLGKLSLNVQNDKIADYKAEELRLSDKINDDPQMLSILPRCFSDNNCRKEGSIGACQDAGALESRCVFSEADKVRLTIIAPKDCRVCDTEGVIKYLRGLFPGLNVSYLNYPDIKAVKAVKDFGIKALPAYLLGKEIEKEKGFDKIRENLEIKGDFYMVKPQFSGISYFTDRKKTPGKFDLFISLYDKDTVNLLEVVKEFNPYIHFLAIEKEGGFEAGKGGIEVEEDLRSVCVQKYYPRAFWDYIACRAKDINSSWWDDCLRDADINKIKACARQEEGRALLLENIRLNKELQIMFGPAYVADEQEIFAFKGVPAKDELKKILKR